MNLTPAMQQYWDIKSKYKDAILFFRMGDFYEMFEEDAKIAHKILGIALTSRNKNAENPVLLAGIPFHAKEKYLPLLV
jgi:DNA mismatch repair protein MutS